MKIEYKYFNDRWYKGRRIVKCTWKDKKIGKPLSCSLILFTCRRVVEEIPVNHRLLDHRSTNDDADQFISTRRTPHRLILKATKVL